MTIITKPLSEKKKSQLEEPLVETTQDDVVPERGDLEMNVVQPASPPKSGRKLTVILALLTLSMACGILGGLYLYQQCLRKPLQRLHGVFSVPYNLSETRKLYYYDPARQTGNQELNSYSMDGRNDYFSEKIEADGLYERIDVPDFRGGRRGRFIHDFEVNKTAILDLDGKRCFVMPLNRHSVLPPSSLMDLIRKMWEGYYDVDTDRVRETMRVEMPPIKDLSTVGRQIARECNGQKTYALVKANAPVFKRSAEIPTVFGFFAGKTTEIAIENYQEMLEAEAPGA